VTTTALIPPVLAIVLAPPHRRARAPTQNFDIIRLPRVRIENIVAAVVADTDQGFPSLEPAFVIVVIFVIEVTPHMGRKSRCRCVRCQFVTVLVVVVVNCFLHLVSVIAALLCVRKYS
jgi:hypothetical protein